MCLRLQSHQTPFTKKKRKIIERHKKKNRLQIKMQLNWKKKFVFQANTSFDFKILLLTSRPDLPMHNLWSLAREQRFGET